MNQHTYGTNFVFSAVAVAVVAGVAGGFLIAHSITGEMGTEAVSATSGHGENGLPEQAGGGRVKTLGEMGTGAVSATSVWANEMEDMKQTDMKGMSMSGVPGMSAAPSGAVVVPAVTRQLIGIRSAPASVASWTRAPGE